LASELALSSDVVAICLALVHPSLPSPTTYPPRETAQAFRPTTDKEIQTASAKVWREFCDSKAFELCSLSRRGN